MASTATSEGQVRALRTHRREMREATSQLKLSTRATLDDIALAWKLQAEKNPYLSLGAVFAAGYVLGGGVPVAAVRLALGVGARMALSMAMREMLAGVTASQRRSRDAEGDSPRRRPSGSSPAGNSGNG
jgi:hypothetical protein